MGWFFGSQVSWFTCLFVELPFIAFAMSLVNLTPILNPETQTDVGLYFLFIGLIVVGLHLAYVAGLG